MIFKEIANMEGVGVICHYLVIYTINRAEKIDCIGGK